MRKMNVCLAGVAVFSAISLPAAAVMFHVSDNWPVSITAFPERPPALSPEGKPIRVISLQGVASLRERNAPRHQQLQPEMKPQRAAELRAAALTPRNVPKQRLVSMQRTTRVTAIPPKRAFAIGSLY